MMDTVTPFDLHMQPPLCSVWCNTNGGAYHKGFYRLQLKAGWQYYSYNLKKNYIIQNIAISDWLLSIYSSPGHYIVNWTEECVWEQALSILTSQIHYLVSLFLVYSWGCRLARAWHTTGGSWSSTRVKEGRALKCREYPQTPWHNPCASYTRSLLLGHFLQLCSQLLRVHTRGTLPTY